MIYDWLKNVSKTGNSENQPKSNFSHKYRKCILKIISKEENDKEFTVMIYFLQNYFFFTEKCIALLMTSSMNEGRKYPLCRHSLNNRIRKERERHRAPRAAVRVERTHIVSLQGSAATEESTLQSVLQKWLHLNGNSFILKLGIRNLKENMVQQFKIVSFNFNTLYASLGNFKIILNNFVYTLKM